VLSTPHHGHHNITVLSTPHQRAPRYHSVEHITPCAPEYHCDEHVTPSAPQYHCWAHHTMGTKISLCWAHHTKGTTTSLCSAAPGFRRSQAFRHWLHHVNDRVLVLALASGSSAICQFVLTCGRLPSPCSLQPMPRSRLPSWLLRQASCPQCPKGHPRCLQGPLCPVTETTLQTPTATAAAPPSP